MKYEPTYYLSKYKKRIIAWSLFAVALVSIISFATWQEQLEQRRGKVEVVVKTVPKDSSIIINGKKYSGSSLYIEPGKYNITISKDGFLSHSQELIVNEVDNPKVYVGLSPDSEEARRWQARHRSDYTDLENQSFEYAQEYGENFQRRWPITKILPIKDPYFTVSYRVDENSEITITIKGTSPRYREFAIEEIRKNGFEPTDYRFEFIGFSNPLEKGTK